MFRKSPDIDYSNSTVDIIQYFILHCARQCSSSSVAILIYTNLHMHTAMAYPCLHDETVHN